MPDLAAGPSPDHAAADEGARHEGATRRRRALACSAGALVAVVALVAYAWPTMARSGDRTDVALAGDGFVYSSQQAVERHLREHGLSVRSFVAGASSLCAVRGQLLDLVHRVHPAVVVLSFRRAEPACPGVEAAPDPTFAVYDEVLRSVGGARVVLAVQPGPADAANGQDQAVQATYAALLAARRATVADPSSLLGGAAAPALMPCQWWDDCRPDGRVQVRQADGGPLTSAGGQRFARVIVGAIP
jgi:hypothetical protein